MSWAHLLAAALKMKVYLYHVRLYDVRLTSMTSHWSDQILQSGKWKCFWLNSYKSIFSLLPNNQADSWIRVSTVDMHMTQTLHSIYKKYFKTAKWSDTFLQTRISSKCVSMMQCFKKEIMVATKKSAFYEWVNVSKPYTHLLLWAVY